MASSKLLLEAHLKALRLPTFLREYDKLARQCAAEELGLEELPATTLRVANCSTVNRRATERRIKAAKFRVTRVCDTFNFPALPGMEQEAGARIGAL